ncbi:MAG TPA: hypothetical protein DDX14_09100, partial [Cyanobacteria bacterium UBA9579]|nr:hypothetical protein [Cyanobacteria bacterium UBA9579]
SVFPGYNPSPYTPQMSYNNPISYGSFGNPMAYNAVSDMFGMSSIFGPGNYIPISGSGSVLSSGLSMANPMQTPLGYNAVSDMFGFNSNLGTSNFNSFTNFATSYENDSSLQRLMQLGDLMFNGGQSTTTPLAKTPTNNSTTTTLSDILLKNTSTNNTGEGDNKLRSLFGGLDSLTTNG